MSLFQDQIAFPGNDIAVTPGDSYQSCSDACLRNSACRAWTFNATQPQHPTCHLKSAVSPAVHNAAATSGTKLQ
ncbi:MAG: PAN domain-containing protein [Acidobacteriota bacterium]